MELPAAAAAAAARLAALAAAGAFPQLLLPMLLLLAPWGWVPLVVAAWAAVQPAAEPRERAWPMHWALLWG
jgi:hypothetical protein